MKFIDQMRERPEEERLVFAMIAASVVAIVLFLIWGFLFFRQGDTIVKVQVSAEQQAATFESLQQAEADITGVVEEFSAQYQKLKKALDEEASGSKQQGHNVVDLYVDDNGDVHVDNIIIPEEEIDFEN